MGMPNYFMHTALDVFPDPLEFRPERWKLGSLQECFATMCRLGEDRETALANSMRIAELYLALAVLFRIIMVQRWSCSKPMRVTLCERTTLL